MNILLLGHHDVASLYALHRLIVLLPSHSHSVMLSSKPPSMQSPKSGLATLEQADANLCQQFLRGDVIGPVAVPLRGPKDPAFDRPNSPQGLRLMNSLQPDLVLSVRYRQILHVAAIAIPRRGVLNLHSGILPDYRGVMATFWAMLAGEKEIGTTLHWIVDSGIDTGPVIDVYRRATRPGRSYLANVLGLYAAGCDAMASAVKAVAAGETLRGRVQTGRGQYFGAPTEADARRFEEKNLLLVDGGEGDDIRAKS